MAFTDRYNHDKVILTVHRSIASVPRLQTVVNRRYGDMPALELYGKGPDHERYQGNFPSQSLIAFYNSIKAQMLHNDDGLRMGPEGRMYRVQPNCGRVK